MELTSIVECLSSKYNVQEKALIYGTEEVSYQELYNCAANYLEYFTENEVVGIVCTNSIDFVVSYFAVIMAKGVALLLNKELKWPEISKLCKQCGSKRIITSENTVNIDDVNIEIKIETIDRASVAT